ncbi:MAG TPA: DCC1-like thiol-disulfide oxidoreductase family protein [Solirubrobacterales bacterium]
MAGVTDYVVLYDRDCGFCRWSTGWLLRLDRRRALEPVAIQDPRGEALLADLAPAERLDSAHVVTPGGERFSAGAIAAPALRLLPGGRPLATLAERFPAAAERVYRFVSGHRSSLGRLVTAGARRRADELIAARRS